MFNCVAAIVFCAGFTWFGWQVAAIALAIDERSASDLRFPMWIYYGALPAGGLLMSIRYVIRLVGLVALRARDACRISPAVTSCRRSIERAR